MSEIAKGGKITVENGIASVSYAAKNDGDADGRASVGVEVKAFVDVPELLDESLKDNATAQLIAKWIDANKSLLPPVEKDI